MLKEKSSYCSNKIEELEYLKDETIKGILQHDKKTFILLESGYAFWFNPNGAFAIETPDEVSKILNQHKGKLIATKKAIENILKLAGEES